MSHLEASLELPHLAIALGTNFWASGEIEPMGYKFLSSFDINPVPQWIWGEEDWQLSRQIFMPYGLQAGEEKLENFADSYLILNLILIKAHIEIAYLFDNCYQGSNTAVLKG